MDWNRDSVNERFVYQGRDAHLRLKECLAKLEANRLYESFADEAAAKASVFDYLDGRDFLGSRESLVTALKLLLTLPPPSLKVFDLQRFAKFRSVLIHGLLNEFDLNPRA